ncbi:MAG: MipA/OmpV family protein [Pseudomonadota bacterium]
MPLSGSDTIPPLRAILLAGAVSCLAVSHVSAQAIPDEDPTEVGTGEFDIPTGPENFVELETAGNENFVLDGVAPGLLGNDGVLDAPNPDAVMTIRGGIQVSPAYFGSDESELGPDASFRIDYLRFPNGFEYGSSQTVGFRQGFGLQGAFKFIGKRDSSEYDEIDGLDDVDLSIEAGLGVGYEQRNYRVFANARYGVIGHNSWTGEVGADGIAYPVDGLTLTFGPRLSLGSDRFAETYYGVNERGAERSGLSEFDAEGGLLGVGVVVAARYLWNERWGVEGAARYDRLTNDAADSPITEAGSSDQYTFTLGITRRISLDF